MLYVFYRRNVCNNEKISKISNPRYMYLATRFNRRSYVSTYFVGLEGGGGGLPLVNSTVLFYRQKQRTQARRLNR